MVYAAGAVSPVDMGTKMSVTLSVTPWRQQWPSTTSSTSAKPHHTTPGQWQVYQSSAPHYPMNQPFLESRRLRPAALPILPTPSTNRALPNPEDWVPDKKQKQKSTGATGAAAAAALSSSGCSSSAAAVAAVEAAWGVAAGPSTAGTDAWAAGAAAAGGGGGRGGGILTAAAAAGSSTRSSSSASAAAAGVLAVDPTPTPAADMRLPVAAAACTSTSQLAISCSSSKAVGAGVSSSTGHHHQWPLLGFNEEGLPMFKGAPCCPSYLGMGQCSAGGSSSGSCHYHHPLAVLVPECVLEGFKPCPVFPGSSVPFSRLVIHLQRLWDYESCEEAQLKVWLAHHLLAAANTGCSMFSTSAARPAVEDAVAAAAGGPSTQQSELQLQHGRYSCSLEEADNVLQHLWLAAPREQQASSGGTEPSSSTSSGTSSSSSSSSSSMPYSGRIAELLQGDPYLQLVDVSGGGGTLPVAVAAVKLQVEAIKELINL